MADASTNSSYYYEQPFEDAATTTTTTTTISNPASNRKRLTIILLVVIGVFIFLALMALIFNKPSTNTTSSVSTNGQKVNLQFWGVYIDPAVMKPLLDDYHTQNPNVTIDYANKWPTGVAYNVAETQYRNNLNSLFRQGDSVKVPDIFMVNNTWVGDYDTNNYTAASTTYDFDTFKSTFYPVVVDDFAHDGVVHGIPLWMDTLAILYNKDLLSEKNTQSPPTTWKEFQDLAVKLTKKENGTIKQGGFAALGTNVSYGFPLFNLLLFQDGVEMLNTKGQPSFSTFSTATDALRFYQGFGNGNKVTWDSTLKTDAAAFLENKAAMIVATSYRYRDIKTTNEKFNLKVNIGISQIPQTSGQAQPVINWADYWGLMTSSIRPNSTVAWDFMKWLSQPDQLKKLSTSYASTNKTFGLLYPRKDMQQILQTDPDLSVFNASLPFARSWYMVKGIEVKGIFNTMLNTGTTDSTALAKAQNDVLAQMSNKGKI